MNISYVSSLISNYQTRVPLFALGIYTSLLGTATLGYSIVFDATGQRQALPALGNTASVLRPQDLILSLGSPYNFNINGASLTMDAIPAPIANAGYILDNSR